MCFALQFLSLQTFNAVTEPAFLNLPLFNEMTINSRFLNDCSMTHEQFLEDFFLPHHHKFTWN